jgi:hypothetical protein
MGRSYSTNKTDKNQKDIVKELYKIPGISVKLDVDDIFVGYKKFNYWFEIKKPDRFNKNGELYSRARKTESKQIELSTVWTGHYQIVSTLDEILLAMGVTR